MEILILQYSLAVLICLWWLQPSKTMRLGKRLTISLSGFLCIFSLLFLVFYMVLHEFSNGNQATRFDYFLFLLLNISLFLMVPAGYLYLRNQFEQKPLKRIDLVHLLPGLVYVAGFVIPWLFYDRKFLFDKEVSASGYFFNIYAYAILGVYILLVVRFLIPFLSNVKRNKNMANILEMKKDRPVKDASAVVHVGSVRFDRDQVAKMDENLKAFFLAEQPFLKQGYNLKKLSEDTSIPVHHLSAFINQHYHTHFNDFINEYRVQYCQAKIRNDEWRAKTLEAIAEESGFNNRNTFTAAFKKLTGYNPSDYLRMIKRQNTA